MATVFEEQNISKAIMRMGLPAMLGQLTTLIYNIADTFFVSLTKEPAMIAAVTLCTPILLIIMSIASVFGMGGNSVIARLLGEEKKKEVRSKKYVEFLSVCNGDCRDRYSARRISLYEADSKNIGRRRGEHGLYL